MNDKKAPAYETVYPFEHRFEDENGSVDAFELLDFLIAESNNPREAVAEFLAEVRREERASIVKEVRAFCARYSTPLEAPERAALTRLAAELEESVAR